MMNLLIRADASPQIGTGHVMRCLALAQAWQDAGGQATFAMALDVPALTVRLKAEGMRVAGLDVQPGSSDDSEQTVKLAHELGARWIVADGYHFTSDYQRAIKDSALDLLFVDDNGDADHYYAYIVLNQNLHAHESLYVNREPYTRLLLGTRYALLRREFLKWCGWQREIPAVARKVLITLGGGDPDNVALKVVQALQQVNLGGLEAVVVVGASNPHYQEIQAAACASRFPIRLESNATNMPELMAWGDVAVSGGGSSCWELAFMGLPNVVLVLASNQEPIAEKLQTRGVAVNLSRVESDTPKRIANALNILLVDAARRGEMSCCGRNLVDGEGALRVVKRLNGEMELVLRPVRGADCRLMWEWANDPDVRAVSFATEPIPWEQHVTWFRASLSDPNCLFFIAMNGENRPLGQIRFNVKGLEAVASVSLDPKTRGQGYGSRLIRSGSEKVFCTTDVCTVHAYAKPDNVASLRAFEKAGFKKLERTTVGESEAVHLVLTKDSANG